MLSAVLLGEVEEGEVARVTGVVRAASRTLRSKLRGTSCVYWDVRAGLAKEPEASEACAFWIEDASGTRALVRSEALRVDVRAQRAQELVETAESDIAAVSESIRALKDRARTTQGPAQGELNRERRRLAKVATVLCAIRAEARENVHVGGTLAGQRKWIEKNLHFANEGGGKLRTIQMRVERFEVVLCDGDPVEIEGRLRREPMPGELGGGYRDLRIVGWSRRARRTWSWCAASVARRPRAKQRCAARSRACMAASTRPRSHAWIRSSSGPACSSAWR